MSIYFTADAPHDGPTLWRATGPDDEAPVALYTKRELDGVDPILWPTLVKALTVPPVWRVDSVPDREVHADSIGARYREREGVWETEAVSGSWVLSAFAGRSAMEKAGYVLSLVSGEDAEVSR